MNTDTNLDNIRIDTSNCGLLDVVNNFEKVARIAAYRGLANSLTAKTIGAIRQHLRDMDRENKKLEEPEASDEFTRTTHLNTDLNEERVSALEAKMRGEDSEEARLLGFTPPLKPLALASKLHAAYDLCRVELETLAETQYDEPLSVEQMLKFMIEQAPRPDEVMLKLVADAAKLPVATIRRMQELEHQREREQLKAARTEILSTFNGFHTNGYDAAIDDLDPVIQHSLGVKVVESQRKAKDSLITRVMRSRRISDLGSIELFDEADRVTSAWVKAFERRHRDELRAAFEAGRTIRSLEDLA